MYGRSMRRISVASETGESNEALLIAAFPVLAESQGDQGRPAAPRPTSAVSPGRWVVRYQQGGFCRIGQEAGSAGPHDAGAPNGFLVLHQGGAMNLRPSLVAGPGGS